MIELVYYQQEYPTKETLTGWCYAKRDYIIPSMKNFRVTEQGELIPKLTRQERFALIYNPNQKNTFKQNIQRPVYDVKYTGITMTWKEFVAKYDITAKELNAEWSE